jgi:hypothetical protein
MIRIEVAGLSLFLFKSEKVSLGCASLSTMLKAPHASGSDYGNQSTSKMMFLGKRLSFLPYFLLKGLGVAANTVLLFPKSFCVDVVLRVD